MILYNFYYSDFKFLLTEITFISLVILSLCFYTFYENKILINSNKIISYSVFLYIFFLLIIYGFIQFYDFDCFYILFNFEFSNMFIFKNFKFLLISLIILTIYSFISLPDGLMKMIKFEYVYVLMFIFIASFFLIFSNDFLGLFLNLELQNFGFYILFSLNKKKKLVAESNIKYYIYGGISSAFLLYGISLIYGATGQINFTDLIMTLSVIDSHNFFLLLVYYLYFLVYFLN
jgi:NADH-quinone oxidoreductase subunit N